MREKQVICANNANYANYCNLRCHKKAIGTKKPPSRWGKCGIGKFILNLFGGYELTITENQRHNKSAIVAVLRLLDGSDGIAFNQRDANFHLLHSRLAIEFLS